MKTIFIAVDFSTTSYNAVRYGIELAKLLNAKLVLFHVFHTAVSIPEAYAVVSSDELKSTAESELKKMYHELKGDASLKMDTLAVEGNVAKMILTYAEKYDECLIVCGLRKSGQMIQKLFGNTITELMNLSQIPIMVIPESLEFKKINTMVFATDLSLETDIHSLSPLLTIGEINHSTLTVLRVMSTDLSVIEEINYRSERLSRYLQLLTPKFEFIKSDEIARSIDQFVDEHDVDLLSLMPRHHSFFEKIFISSEARKLLFITDVPLLLLPEFKIKILPQDKNRKYNRVESA